MATSKNSTFRINKRVFFETFAWSVFHKSLAKQFLENALYAFSNCKDTHFFPFPQKKYSVTQNVMLL